MAEITLKVFDGDPDEELCFQNLNEVQRRHLRQALTTPIMAGIPVVRTAGEEVRRRRATIEETVAQIAKTLQGGVLVRFES